MERLIVRWHGKIFGNNSDSKLLIRLNGETSGYRSYAIMSGDDSEVGSDANGLYVGRNGWHQDADVSLQYIIDVRSGQKRTGYGQSTFAHNIKVLGYTASGYWVNTANPIQSADLYLEGNGSASGSLSIRWD